MRRNDVVRTVIVGSPEATIFKGPTGFAREVKYNLEVLKIAKAYPNQFIAFPTINPIDPTKLEKLESYVRGGGRGLKLYSGHASFYDLPLDHENMLPVYQFCEDRGVPILFHVNTRKFGEEFERVLKKFPRLKVNCPHLCLAVANTNRFEHFMDTYTNLRTDISMGAPEFLKDTLIRYSKEPEKYRRLFIKYQDRILFGTDNVITSAGFKTVDWIDSMTRVYRNVLEKETYRFALVDTELNGLRLDENVLEKIYRLNFEQFFGK